MFGGVTAAQFNQSNQAHAASYLALCLLLIEKGVITEAEIEKARMQATQIVDQEWARKREESEREFEEQHPGVRQLFSKMLGTDSSD